jgi:integrase/recombinase XerD
MRRGQITKFTDIELSSLWFRYADASNAIDRGAPVSLVQQTLGHADLRTTSRYVHARPNDSASLRIEVSNQTMVHT